MTITTLEAKKAIREKFAWPGGYEMYLVMSDSGVVCMACARKEWRSIAYSMHYNLSDGWRAESIGVTCNDEDIVTCDHCGRTIFDPNA
jgi:hypothetical protein